MNVDEALTAAPLTGAQAESVRAASEGAQKIVVAVHGIGDQYRNATIQTVVSAFGRFLQYPAAIPLGGFDGGGSTIQAFQLKAVAALSSIGFVEVYWADIPRAAQKEGYIIEESKAWARTVVERVRARFSHCAQNLTAKGPENQSLFLNLEQKDYFAGADVIEEMIETFAVLDNLLFVAEKAGLLKFDLGFLLTQYIGDVQMVADFAPYRATILTKFRQVLDEVYEHNQTADIYIVSHSEGTVVAFMGLLDAMCGYGHSEKEVKIEIPPPWVKQVRGIMTFGSPIDKHLILWPDIWDPLQNPHRDLSALRSGRGGEKIRWRNYYDYGDPVGFRLDTARDWLKTHGWDNFLDFTDAHDHGFGRYLLPGAAHNDYWADDAVFGHFLQNVIGLEPPKGSNFKDPPGDKPLKRLCSNVIPYALIALLLYLAVYLLSKGVIGLIAPGESATPESSLVKMGTLIRGVIGVTALLAGMIALARIPRLTRSPRWIGIACCIFVGCAALYAIVAGPEAHQWHAMHLFDSWPNPEIASSIFVIAISGVVAGFAAWGSRRKLREWTSAPLASLRSFFVGARPLIIPGATGVLLVVGCGVARDWKGTHSLWPLVLASAAFLYLWWLATLLFDLVFVWHRYIRHSVVHNYLYALRRERKSGIEKSPGNVSSPAQA